MNLTAGMLTSPRAAAESRSGSPTGAHSAGGIAPRSEWMVTACPRARRLSAKATVCASIPPANGCSTVCVEEAISPMRRCSRTGSVPPAAREPAEGDQADQEDDQSHPEADDEQQDDADDDEDAAQRVPADAAALSRICSHEYFPSVFV